MILALNSRHKVLLMSIGDLAERIEEQGSVDTGPGGQDARAFLKWLEETRSSLSYFSVIHDQEPQGGAS